MLVVLISAGGGEELLVGAHELLSRPQGKKRRTRVRKVYVWAIRTLKTGRRNFCEACTLRLAYLNCALSEKMSTRLE